jgi:hypothetical protein
MILIVPWWDFSLLLNAIKKLFKGSGLEFCGHLTCCELLFWLETIKITQVLLPSLEVVSGVSELSSNSLP